MSLSGKSAVKHLRRLIAVLSDAELRLMNSMVGDWRRTAATAHAQSKLDGLFTIPARCAKANSLAGREALFAVLSSYRKSLVLTSNCRSCSPSDSSRSTTTWITLVNSASTIRNAPMHDPRRRAASYSVKPIPRLLVDDQVHRAGFVLERDERDALGRAWPLPHQHHPRDVTGVPKGARPVAREPSATRSRSSVAERTSSDDPVATSRTRDNRPTLLQTRPAEASRRARQSPRWHSLANPARG